MKESAFGIAGHFHDARIDLVGQKKLDAFLPYLVRFAHGYPHVGIDEVASGHAFGHVVGTQDGRAAFLRHGPGSGHDVGAGLKRRGGHGAEVHAQFGRAHHE